MAIKQKLTEAFNAVVNLIFLAFGGRLKAKYVTEDSTKNQNIKMMFKKRIRYNVSIMYLLRLR